MAREREGGKNQQETGGGIGYARDGMIDDRIGAADEWLLDKPVARVVKDPHPSGELVRGNDVDRVHSAQR